MATGPWTAKEDALLRELHTAGHTLGDTATETARSQATVSRHPKRLGLGWDREQAKGPTAARKVDAEARRAQIKVDLLADAARMREQLWKPSGSQGCQFLGAARGLHGATSRRKRRSADRSEGT